MGTSLSLSSARRVAVWLAVGFAIATLIAMQALPARAGGGGQILYGADGAGGNPSSLLTIDPATGSVLTTIGPIGFAVTGLAFHPTTGVLYGTTSNNSPVEPGALITVDITTGVGTLVGQLVPADETAADITFGSDGTLYGWLEANTDDLVTINLTTGAATVVGDSGLSTAGAALAGNANPLALMGDDDDGDLDLIDIGTGAVTSSVALLGTTGQQVGASDLDSGGTLYAVRINNNVTPRTTELLIVNPVSGAVTVVGPSANNLDAIAFDLSGVTPSVVPSIPNAATSQPITDPTGAALWILGFVLVIGAASLAVRSVAVVRNR